MLRSDARPRRFRKTGTMYRDPTDANVSTTRCRFVYTPSAPQGADRRGAVAGHGRGDGGAERFARRGRSLGERVPQPRGEFARYTAGRFAAAGDWRRGLSPGQRGGVSSRSGPAQNQNSFLAQQYHRFLSDSRSARAIVDATVLARFRDLREAGGER